MNRYTFYQLLALLLVVAAVQPYCRATQTTQRPDAASGLPAPTPSPLSPNVSIGSGTVQSCYPNADFVLKFNNDENIGRVTVSINDEVCIYPNAEVFADSRSSWLAVWAANYVRVSRDGVTEGSIEGQRFTFKPTE